MPLRAIVFDFDGVIANSEPLHLRAFQDVLRGEGVGLNEREYYERYLGYDDVGAFRAIGIDNRRAWSPEHLASLAARKAARMEHLEREASVLFPGAEAAIHRAADAVPIAIASGAIRAEIVRVLDRAGLRERFAAIVAAQDTPVGKPAPDPYARAVGLLAAAMDDPSLRPDDCVAIEDSRWGLESARTAGLRTVAVTSSYDEADLPGADLVIASLADLDITVLRGLCSRDRGALS